MIAVVDDADALIQQQQTCDCNRKTGLSLYTQITQTWWQSPGTDHLLINCIQLGEVGGGVGGREQYLPLGSGIKVKVTIARVIYFI